MKQSKFLLLTVTVVAVTAVLCYRRVRTVRKREIASRKFADENLQYRVRRLDEFDEGYMMNGLIS